MVIVDTSIWIDHFRAGNPALESLLLEADVAVHPFVLGELACGGITRTSTIFSYLRELPEAPLIDQQEFYPFVENNTLSGAGIGFVDVHLLASARVASMFLWTFDKKLMNCALTLKVAYKSHGM
jgi:predicted nucleic acid-binding protein